MIFLLLLVINTVLGGNLVATGGNTADNVGSDFVIATTNQALRSIKSAEAAGADISDLIARFNVAIDLQQQAERGTYESCPSYNECIVLSNTMLLSIVEDATTAGNSATSRNEQAKLLMFTVYVPAGSFVASVAIVVTYRAWQSRRAKRYQRMDIYARKEQ